MILYAFHAILFLQYNHVLIDFLRYSWKFLCNRTFNQCIFKPHRGCNFTFFYVYRNMKYCQNLRLAMINKIQI
jgi:hypothetical protein